MPVFTRVTSKEMVTSFTAVGVYLEVGWSYLCSQLPYKPPVNKSLAIDINYIIDEKVSGRPEAVYLSSTL